MHTTPPCSVVIIGPPGSGKGTQARCLNRFFGMEHIDMGMELRHMAREDSEFGREIDRIIHKERKLVPDEYVRTVLTQALENTSQESGIVLDGAPRRVEQITIVEDVLKEAGKPLVAVVYIDVSEEAVIERISHRYFCPKCFGFYIDGKDVADATKDRCPRCGYPLEKRKDDTPEGVRNRLSVFSYETRPVVQVYRDRGLLLEVSGDREIDTVCEDVHARVLHVIQELYESEDTRGNSEVG